EPTSGLDPIGTRQVKDLIIELGKRGKTVLLSSHLLADVEDCVDRMVILYGGKIREEGPAEALLTKQSRTSIETDALDEETIAEIDAVIRRRSHGEKSVLGVSHPRQRLEEKFLDIVARAKAERVETSGATEGGEVASFLKGSGAGLIDRLVQGDEPPAEVEVESGTGRDEPSVREDVIAGLVSEAPAEEAPVREPDTAEPVEPAGSDEPAGSGDVDMSVIGSLLDREDEGDDEDEESRR
ncbi:MAG: hypothetical protein ACF8SC_12845, partial [Phycisphaerales bacterium JB037]